MTIVCCRGLDAKSKTCLERLKHQERKIECLFGIKIMLLLTKYRDGSLRQFLCGLTIEVWKFLVSVCNK